MQSFDKMPSMVTEEMQLWKKSKMADGGHIFWQTRTKFRLGHKGTLLSKQKQHRDQSNSFPQHWGHWHCYCWRWLQQCYAYACHVSLKLLGR